MKEEKRLPKHERGKAFGRRYSERMRAVDEGTEKVPSVL